MDLNKKEAVLCGEALQLTKTEFEILRLLLENEGLCFRGLRYCVGYGTTMPRCWTGR